VEEHLRALHMGCRLPYSIYTAKKMEYFFSVTYSPYHMLSDMLGDAAKIRFSSDVNSSVSCRVSHSPRSIGEVLH
jgi:hypothetical protein